MLLPVMWCNRMNCYGYPKTVDLLLLKESSTNQLKNKYQNSFTFLVTLIQQLYM